MNEQQVSEAMSKGLDLGLSLVVGAIGKVLENPNGRMLITSLGAMFFLGLMFKILRR
jgi:hypothetical protein